MPRLFVQDQLVIHERLQLNRDPSIGQAQLHRGRCNAEPGVLRKELGEDYLVIEKGLNRRTTVWDDPIEGYKNGKTCLFPCIETHKPLDLVIILLGTNDLKMRFSVSAYDIANGAGAPQVLLLASPPVAKLTGFTEMFEGAEAKSRRFLEHYRRVAEERGCAFLDTGQVIVSSDLDGIHLEASEQKKLGKAVTAKVRELLA